jgi:hypothetical protein
MGERAPFPPNLASPLTSSEIVSSSHGKRWWGY